MTGRQFQLLVDRYNLERQASDLRAGMLCALLANTAAAFGGGKGRRFQPADFFSSLTPLRRRQTPEEMAAILEAFAMSQNAKVGQA